MKNLCDDRKINFKNDRDARSFLLIENLVRQKLNDAKTFPARWSPLSVIDYVEHSSPCKSMSEEVQQYRKFVSTKPDIHFSVV